MNEQLTLDGFDIANQEVDDQDLVKFQADNEGEEDIQDVENLSFSDLAVTGTDWTVETIISQMKKGNIQLDPSFQRRDAWTAKVKSRFIESLFLGLPIPQIILAEQKDRKGKFFVIDGKQRLLSLKQFALPDQETKALKLTGLDVLSQFNRKTYSDIESSLFSDDIDGFNNQPIRTVVIKNWKSVGVLYLLFLRLNTGSVKLSPQELRQALYPGAFVDYINLISLDNKQLQRMLKITKADFRMRDVEILIRYLAFCFYAKDYAGSMQNFLDMTCERLNKSFSTDRPRIEEALNAFNWAIDLTYEVFGEKGAFRKYRGGKYEEKYNRAVIDIMLFFFTQLKDREMCKAYSKEIRSRFEELCTSDSEFRSSLESTTKSLTAVHYRFRKWGEQLQDILGEELTIPLGY